MPRANRYMLEGNTYHLVNRCLNKEFLFRFAKDRSEYCRWLTEGVKRFKVPIYAYCVTSNHVHLVVRASSTESVAELMHLVDGTIGRNYNRRKDRTGPFWNDQYSCVAVESGRHLLSCLVYVHLNMVRAGVVGTPEEWKWCGHSELIFGKSHHRIIDMESLLGLFNGVKHEEFVDSYKSLLVSKLKIENPAREPGWTENLAVGSQRFVESIKKEYPSRVALETFEIKDGDFPPGWAVRESQEPYHT